MKERQIIAFSRKGEGLANRLAALLDADAVRCGEGCTLSHWTADRFPVSHGLIFVGAAGIAVRAIAPYVNSKATDPAVVVVDELGRYAIPILSGHLGGANALAEEIAAAIGAQPIITTATDIHGIFSPDAWARAQGMYIPRPEGIRPVSSRLLEGETVTLCSDWPISGTSPAQVQVTDAHPCDIQLTLRPHGDCLTLVPRIVVLGIGCRRNACQEDIEAAFASLMEAEGIPAQAICRVCSIDLKANEPGLLAFCATHGWTLKTFPAETLAAQPGHFTPSDFVAQTTGVDNVCQRSAVAGSGGGRLLTRKYVFPGVTMALAEQPFSPDWRWRNE